MEIARAVKAAEPYLMLCGIEGFEGMHAYLSSAEAVPKVRPFLESIVAAARRIDQEGLLAAPEIILSAGGSAYFDLVAEIFGRAQLARKATVVLRSGCYLTHDAGWGERLFEDARERSGNARQIKGG